MQEIWEIAKITLAEVVWPVVSVALLVALFQVAREAGKLIKDARLRAIVAMLVKAAEQIFGPGGGDAKRTFVYKKAAELGYNPVDVETVMESEVLNLTREEVIQ